MKSIFNTILAILSLIYSSWVLSLLWLWFIVPLGVPAIGVIHAFGISTIALMFRGIHDNDDDFVEALFKSAILVTIILVFGGIAFLLM